MWGLSGLGHPIISRLGPEPAAFAPPRAALQLASLQPLAVLLEKQGIAELQRARLLNWDGRAVYRIEAAGEVQYLDARSGALIADGERDYAVWLARYYAFSVSSENEDGPGAVTRVDAFDDDYLFINRLLPVQRVDFDREDGLRAYVDTASGRLASLIDEPKALTGRLFRALHSWTFIPDPPLRRALMSLCLLAAFATALAGLSQYLLQRRAGRLRWAPSPTLKWHRRIGAVLALAALMLSGSGLYHLLHKPLAPAATAPAPTVDFASAELGADWAVIAAQLQVPLWAAELVAVDGQPWWRLQTHTAAAGRHHHHGGGESSPVAAAAYAHAGGGAVDAERELVHARELAAHYSGLPAAEIRELQQVTQFGGEYGFINKRLPVYAVHYRGSDQLSFYVEPLSGALAARVDNGDRREGFSFAYLHKWHFLDGLGRDARDAILASAALGIVAVFALGGYLYLRRRLTRRGRDVGAAAQAETLAPEA